MWPHDSELAGAFARAASDAPQGAALDVSLNSAPAAPDDGADRRSFWVRPRAAA